MSAEAITHYTNIVRYDPQAVQRMRDATAQARQQQQRLWLVQRDQSDAATVDHTLEGELLNKQGEAQPEALDLTEAEYLERHEEQRSRSTEGYQAPAQRAVATYQTIAQLTHPADVDRIGMLDIYV